MVVFGSGTLDAIHCVEQVAGEKDQRYGLLRLLERSDSMTCWILEKSHGSCEKITHALLLTIDSCRIGERSIFGVKSLSHQPSAKFVVRIAASPSDRYLHLL